MEQDGVKYNKFKCLKDMLNDLCDYIKNINLEKIDINRVPARTLAYIGDAVYELLLRLWLVNSSKDNNYKLTKSVIPVVNCDFQSYLFDKIFTNLCYTEQSLMKNWRNAKCSSKYYNIQKKKNYSKATALEAFIGYLFLTNQTQRIYNIVELAIIEYSRGLNIVKRD